MRRAASRADCTAGSNSAISTAMIAMTTSNSISVNPTRGRRTRHEPIMVRLLLKLNTDGKRNDQVLWRSFADKQPAKLVITTPREWDLLPNPCLPS